MANQIKEPEDVWELEHYLTERRKEIDGKYDYRYSQLTHVFGRLLYERRITEDDLRGFGEDEMKPIRSLAELLAKYAAWTGILAVIQAGETRHSNSKSQWAINCFYEISERKQAEDPLQHAHDKLEFLVQKRSASLRRLSSHLQHVQDDERRIARDLHDSAGQYLAALKMNLAQLNRADPTKALAVLAESNQLLDTCLAEIRTISYLLHPPMLDESGLASAAAWYVEGFAKRSSIQTNLELSPRLQRLPADTDTDPDQRKNYPLYANNKK
jgi:signal transduction histidine kinase